jgi:ELWxxDGT repeat protein
MRNRRHGRLRGVRGAIALVAAACLLAPSGARAGADRVTDLARGKEDSSPRFLTALGSKLYFSATAPRVGTELFRLNAGGRHAKLLRDIVPGEEGFGLREQPVAAGDRLFFRVRCPVDVTIPSCEPPTAEVWVSDGNRRGTQPVHGAAPDSRPRSFTAFGDRLLLTAADELWVTDGTQAGSLPLGVQPRSADYIHRGSIRYVAAATVGDVALFQGWDEAHGGELWRTDGTPGGTSLVADLIPGEAGSEPGNLTSMGAYALFIANPGDPDAHQALMRTDGSTVQRLVGLGRYESVSDDLFAGHITPARNGAFFVSSEQEADGHLWWTDGTAEGTRVLRSFHSEAWANPFGDDFAAAGRNVFFTVYDKGNGNGELWTSDGTPEGTRVVRDLAGPGSPGVEDLTAAGKRVYFTAETKAKGRELWMSDGTRRGTKLVRDIRRGPRDTDIEWLTAVGQRVYFTAEDSHGRELWTAR